MNRDESIKSIRPILSILDIDKKPMESFQNDTLRPILKLQHLLTLSLLKNHKNYKPSKLVVASKQQYDSFITKYIQTNIDLKNQLLGSVIGLFTEDELAFYNDNRKEVNKRIIQMQLKRYVDTEYVVVKI